MRKFLFIMIGMCFIFCAEGVDAKETDSVSIHFLSVGQADCTWIHLPDGKDVLIDSGSERSAQKVISYLKRKGVEEIHLLIATHPHHDHIGSMDELIHAFPVDVLYLPALSHHTRHYHNLIKAVKSHGVTLVQAKAGQNIQLSQHVQIAILAPLGKDYRNMNNSSLVLKLTHGDNRFLFMADAGKKSADEMLEKNTDLHANVLRIAHHGGALSTSAAFLEAVDPEYAVLSVGNHNGFPSRHVIDLLKHNGVKLFQTNRLGTIVAISDGHSISFHTHQ